MSAVDSPYATISEVYCFKVIAGYFSNFGWKTLRFWVPIGGFRDTVRCSDLRLIGKPVVDLLFMLI